MGGKESRRESEENAGIFVVNVPGFFTKYRSCLPMDNRLIFSYTLHSGVDFFNRIPMKRHSGYHLWTPLFSWICFFGDFLRILPW